MHTHYRASLFSSYIDVFHCAGDKLRCKQVLLESKDPVGVMNMTARIVAHDVSLETGVPPEQTYGKLLSLISLIFLPLNPPVLQET